MENETLAKQEIKDSLKLSNTILKLLGFTLNKPATVTYAVVQKCLFITTIVIITIHVLSELACLYVTSITTPQVDQVVPLLHIVGYGTLGILKFTVLCSKRKVFAQLLSDLATIWPVPPLVKEAQSLKNSNLRTLRLMHSWYFALNESGTLFYIITPIGLYIYYHIRGQAYAIKTVWKSWYPFNIYQQEWIHILIYIFEIFSGQSCVWAMIGSDLLFTGMVNHIILLLKILQQRLRNLGRTESSSEDDGKKLIECIKLHQRLIKYCKDLENAFSLVNLINICLSSVNICCVLFVIVLIEPRLGLSNKLFFGASLIQIGLICWYGEDLIQENANIAEAAYNSNWYNLNPSSRRRLAFLIQRAQKPIAFTAMGFTNISLVTYSAILTRSYSYFTLLYTMYSEG
ncbi:odorant receptor 4-like [Pieris rapae]|uniref:odorant receptor 4-like n=1 Tax=Pieris rapae TaxID=64459 RepID=UPI001E27CA33|nr:odorant receptor 4-like [Pieris rapae]